MAIPTVLLKPEKKTAQTLGSFDATLAAHGHDRLRSLRVDTLQVNVGKLCNQTCTHCHVDAGPTRTEIMKRETAEAVLAVVRRYPELRTVYFTGGAPETNPHFEYLVEQCRAMGRHVMDRCNLTVCCVRGKEHLPRFLAVHQVEVIASLPCYLKENVDQQRGKGVYDRSIAALQALNALGYGREWTGLVLNLVYNPLGPKLPPPQAELEADYRNELAKRFGITFNRLYTITNMPISRFLGFAWLRPLRAVRGTAGDELQSGCGGRAYVTEPDQRELGRPPVGLRLQPDAG